MSSIRDMFHEVGNCHNKMTVGAGVTKAVIQESIKNGCNKDDLEEILKRIDRLEKHALESDEALLKLKEVIYNILNPDTGQPFKAQGGN